MLLLDGHEVVSEDSSQRAVNATNMAANSMNISDMSNEVVEEIGLVLRGHVSKNTSPMVMSSVDGVPDGVMSSVDSVLSPIDGLVNMSNNMVPEIFLIFNQTVLRVSENLSPNVTDPIGVSSDGVPDVIDMFVDMSNDMVPEVVRILDLAILCVSENASPCPENVMVSVVNAIVNIASMANEVMEEITLIIVSENSSQCAVDGTVSAANAIVNIANMSNEVVEEIGLILRAIFHVSENTSPMVMSSIDGVPDGVMSTVDGLVNMSNNMVPEIFLVVDQTVLRVSENLSPNVTNRIVDMINSSVDVSLNMSNDMVPEVVRILDLAILCVSENASPCPENLMGHWNPLLNVVHDFFPPIALVLAQGLFKFVEHF
jgi:hypothetical protein